MKQVNGKPVREVLTKRGEEVWDEAMRRSKTTAGDRLARLKDLALPVIQSAVAAAAAWVFALEVVGHESPFFAPVAAVIAIGVTLGQRGRRAIELVVGVALGVAVADILIAQVGTGAWQIALAVILATTAAVLLGGGELLRIQAAVSAVLVATLEPPSGTGLDFERATDALIGGVAALIVGGLLPAQPLARVKRAAKRAIPELAATIDDIAAATRARDKQAAEKALERARTMDQMTDALRDEVQTGYEMMRMSPPRRGSRERLVTYGEAASQLDLAVRNVRVMARGLVRALDHDDNVPESLADAMDDLSEAVRGLGTALEQEGEGGDAARAAAVRAAGQATLVLEDTGNLSVSVLVGQVRSTAADLLRGLGLEREDAQEAVREAAELVRD